VLYTRSTGAVTLAISKAGWDLRTMDGQRLSSGNPEFQTPHLKLGTNANPQYPAVDR
jgi:hypothetical protein